MLGIFLWFFRICLKCLRMFPVYSLFAVPTLCNACDIYLCSFLLCTGVHCRAARRRGGSSNEDKGKLELCRNPALRIHAFCFTLRASRCVFQSFLQQSGLEFSVEFRQLWYRVLKENNKNTFLIKQHDVQYVLTSYISELRLPLLQFRHTATLWR